MRRADAGAATATFVRRSCLAGDAMARNISTLRPSPGLGAGGAPSRGPQLSSLVSAIIVLTAILLVLLAILWLRQRAEAKPPATSQPAAVVGAQGPARAEVVSENGIIFGGVPRARRGDIRFTVLRNQAYIVGYSEERRDPLWAAYHVFRATGPVHEERPRGSFITDTRTQAQVSHHDFTGSGYDRGHMAPNFAIATRFGPAAQLETFLLSNICPQAPALNQKVWEHLEKAEIDYANQLGEVWVMDGPIFDDLRGGPTRKLRSGISVPSSFYKIIIENHAGTPRLFCVIMPQTVKGTEMPQQFVTSVRTIEEKTQLEFLWTLDAGTQRALKEKIWPMW
jgi:endonuclease G